MSFWRRLGAALGKPARWGALASGALLVLAFPAPNLEFLAWFGLVPGLLLMHAAPSAREAAVRAWWFGAGFIMAAHYWLAPNIGPALLLVAIVLGALWAGVGVSTWALLRPPMTLGRSLAALVVVPSYWLLVEWIRSWQALGGPWALLGASQWQHPAMLALASVGGVWLVSFALVAANTGIVILVTAPRAALRAVGAVVAVAATGAGPLAFALTPEVHPAGQVTVALVQPGYQAHPSPLGTASQRLTARLGPRHPDLIVWGESSIGEDLRFHHALLDQLRRLSATAGAPILVNQDSITPAGKSKVAVLVDRGGIVATYTKTRLVPFGEYIPFRQQLGWLTRISKAAPSNMIRRRGTGDDRDPAGRAPAQARRADLLRGRLPRHVPRGHAARCPADRLPDLRLNLPGQLGTRAARGAVRSAGGRDRPAGGAGGADRGHRRLRRTRPAARLAGHGAARGRPGPA